MTKFCSKFWGLFAVHGENYAISGWHFQDLCARFPLTAKRDLGLFPTSPLLVATSSHLIRISPDLIRTSPLLIFPTSLPVKIKRELVKNKRAEFHAEYKQNSRLVGI